MVEEERLLPVATLGLDHSQMLMSHYVGLEFVVKADAYSIICRITLSSLLFL